MSLGVGLSARRIFLYRGICSMRRSFDRLAWMIKEELEEDPLTGDLFVFLNKSRKMLKCLYWDKDGYAIWYKRLEHGRFVMPTTEGKEIDITGWTHLLEGIEAKVIKRQPRYCISDEKRRNNALLDEKL